MRVLAVAIALYVSAVVRLPGQSVGQIQFCADTKYPDSLPAPSALVDSAHAISDLAAFADPSKPMLFSVYFDEGDSVAHVRALDKNDAAAAVSVANYIRHTARRALWAFRVRIAGGDAPALTVERSKYCPPVSREGDVPFATMLRASVPVVVGSNPEPIEGGKIEAHSVVPVEALISADGRVIVSRVVQSTGNADFDARIVRNMKSLRFEPAKLDGQPIQALFRSRGESPRP